MHRMWQVYAMVSLTAKGAAEHPSANGQRQPIFGPRADQQQQQPQEQPQQQQQPQQQPQREQSATSSSLWAALGDCDHAEGEQPGALSCFNGSTLVLPPQWGPSGTLWSMAVMPWHAGLLLLLLLELVLQALSCS